MKLSSVDYAILQRAADVADAQREFLERSRAKSMTVGYGAVLAALAAIALASLVTLTSLA